MKIKTKHAIEADGSRNKKRSKQKFTTFYVVNDILHDTLFFSHHRRQRENIISNNIYASECYY